MTLKYLTVWIASVLATLSISADEKANDALKRGGEFLVGIQNVDGSFGKSKSPAVAALCAIALKDVPMDVKLRDVATKKAMTFVMGFVKKDGSVTGKPGRHFVFFSDAGYPTYTTAVALLAMDVYGYAHDPKTLPIMKGAREYLKASQIEDKDSKHFGGFSYGKSGKADLSNTAWAAEALHATEDLDKEPYVKKGEKTKKTSKEMWSALDTFLKSAQNLPKDKDDKKRDGGFAYRPGNLVSSGSMTYSGLKSMIYAKLDISDPRVKGVLNYVRKNYTVTENPGQGTKGYFYYLQTMTKALNAVGSEYSVIKTLDGKTHEWRKDVIAAICSMQTTQGAWVNVNGKYMESDLNLVTAYAMITLKQAMSPSKQGD